MQLQQILQNLSERPETISNLIVIVSERTGEDYVKKENLTSVLRAFFYKLEKI